MTRAATADVAGTGRAVSRGGQCALAPTWPEGPKEGSRRPARHGFPRAAHQLRAGAAPPCGQRFSSRGAIQVSRRVRDQLKLPRPRIK